MKSTIRYLTLSVLIVFSLSIQRIGAQDFDETISYADNLMKSGNLTTALKMYQRALFFSEGRRSLYLFRQIAEISYINDDYETAQKYFGFAINQTDNDSLRTELLFSKASCQILNKDFQMGLIDLFSVNDTTAATQKRLNFYIGTCYFGLEDFSQARTYFATCVPADDSTEIGALFTKKNLLSPSPKKAKVMSMIIPGLGQTYSGDLKAGLNSLLLTSGLIALAANIGIRYRPLDAILSILPWYQRYYTGGYGKAEEIAKRKRQQKRNEVYTEILKILAEHSAG